MPRIPVRTEPYSSPSRQHRHFKNKRDQILRALGKSSYINGSHFAILWVTASGHSETYASDAFQGSLDEWFENSGVQAQAKQIVKQRSGPSSKRPAELDDDDSRDVFTDDECDDQSVDPADASASRRSSLLSTVTASRKSVTPLMACDDVFGSSSVPQNVSAAGASSSKIPLQADAISPLVGDLPTFTKTDVSTGSTPPSASRLARKPLAPLDINSANSRFNSIAKGTLPPPISASDDAFLRGPLSAPLPHQPTSHKFRRTQVGRVPSGSSPLNNLTDVLLADRAARTAFFELRFSQMQQGMCKTVAKAWIKIIEPKKQTRCPYNKGEEGKPEWWPAGVRHKEPDHLMKPERHSLLLAILRSPKIKVSRLQLATAEVVAMIKADKVNLLMDVYRVAREEERFREEGKGDAEDIPITVGVSTLEGWRVGRDGEKGGLNEEGKLATIAEDSPEDVDKKIKKAIKRRPSTQLSQAAINMASASGPHVAKKTLKQPPRPRTTTQLQANASRSSASMQASHSAPNFVAQATMPLQSAGSGTHSVPMASSSNHTFLSDAEFHQSIDPFNRQVASGNVASYNGEMRPHPFDNRAQTYMPSASPMIDQQQGNFTPVMHQTPGTMSAPQVSAVHLFPPQQPPSSSISADSSPAVPQYSFNFNGSFVNPFDNSSMSSRIAQEPHFSQQQVSPFMPQATPHQAAGASALGLQGMSDGSLWTQAFEVANPGVLAPSHAVEWSNLAHNGAHMQPQSEHILRSPFAGGVPATAPARLTPLPNMTAADDSVGDLTMDQSFASNTTTGPATPPVETRGLGISAAHRMHDGSHGTKHHQFLEAGPRFEYSALAAGMYSNANRREGPNGFDGWNSGI